VKTYYGENSQVNTLRVNNELGDKNC